MFYQGFEQKFLSSNKYWTPYDDQLVSLLFSRIINRSHEPNEDTEEAMDTMINNLFDLCFYINKDFRYC